MKALTNAALHGGGLILIDRKESIDRYRDCMMRLGLEPTRMDSFHIDGIGWSPEIADELGRDYLSHGIANPRGIVITVNQEDRPIFAPTHSFDRLLISRFFQANRQSIAELTVETGIALEIDQRRTWYRKLADIESVRRIVIVSHGGNLSEVALQQRELVSTFVSDTDAWMDHNLREEIIEGFEKHGKRYDRSLVIEDFTFTDFDDFYTTALGGVYIFRHNRKLALIVIEDESLLDTAEKLGSKTVSLNSVDIIDRILDSGVAGINLDWYRKNPDVLKTRLDSLAVLILSSIQIESQVDEMSSAQIIGALSKIDHPLIDLYAQFEEIRVRITDGEEIEDIPREIAKLLLHPINVSSKYEENLVWRLICHVQQFPVDIMRMYVADKNLFVDRYRTWSKPMRAYARKQIRNYNSSQTYQERNVT